MDKQLIFVERVAVDLFALFDGCTLTDAITTVIGFKDKMDKKYTDKNMIVGEIHLDHCYDYIDSYIEVHRWETDDEYNTRIQKELEKAEQKRIKNEQLAEKRLKKQQQKDLKELEELAVLRTRVAELEKKHGTMIE